MFSKYITPRNVSAISVLVALAACTVQQEELPGGYHGTGGSGTTTSSGKSVSSSGGSEDVGLVPQGCAPGEYASGMDENDNLVCTSINSAVLGAVNERCSVYFGWKDGCDGCMDGPSKWGRVTGNSCENGAGDHNSCAPVDVDGASVQMFGLNTDGDVDENDKFYAGIQCEELDATPAVGPCGPGELMTGISDGEVSCVSLAALVSSHVRNSCELHLGWRDGCDGCTDGPSKWGSVSHDACESGPGADNTCTLAAMGEPEVPLLGINTDGDVDGNDTFFVGMSCAAPLEQAQEQFDNCPAGMAVTGINEDGSLACASPLAAANSMIRQSCKLYSGWLDGCDDCTTAPSKWGWVSQDECQSEGADNTCTEAALGDDTVRLLGINTDGDVDENDKFYFGMQCN